MKTVYRDGDVINAVERHYHLDRVVFAIGVLGIVLGAKGLWHIWRWSPSPSAGCRDSVTELGMFTTRAECGADQTLENTGYGRMVCRCKSTLQAAPLSTSWGSLSGSYYTLTPGSAGQVLFTSDAGAGWRAQ